MKTLRTSKKAKAAAFILCVLCLTLALGCRGPPGAPDLAQHDGRRGRLRLLQG